MENDPLLSFVKKTAGNWPVVSLAKVRELQK